MILPEKSAQLKLWGCLVAKRWIKLLSRNYACRKHYQDFYNLVPKQTKRLWHLIILCSTNRMLGSRKLAWTAVPFDVVLALIFNCRMNFSLTKGNLTVLQVQLPLSQTIVLYRWLYTVYMLQIWSSMKNNWTTLDERCSTIKAFSKCVYGSRSMNDFELGSQLTHLMKFCAEI